VLGLTVIVFYLRESPRYLMFKNVDEGIIVLEDIAAANNDNQFKLTPEDKTALKYWVNTQHEESNNLSATDISYLFSGVNARITITLWIMWFFTFLVMYGVIYVLPETLVAFKDTTNNNFGQIAFAVLGEVLSAAVAFFVIENENFGRKNSLFYSYTLGAFVLIVSYFARGSFFIICIFLAKFFINAATCFLFPLTSEMYHTRIRTTGIGLANALSALGGITMPFVSLESFEISPTTPYLLFGIAFVITSVASFMVPYDTTSMELDITPKKSYQNLS